MQRPPLSRRSRHRTHALARVAAAAGVALMLTGLAACKGGEESAGAVAAPARPVATGAASAPSAIAGIVTSPVPPPPDLAKLPPEAPEAPAASAPVEAAPSNGVPTAKALADAHAQLESALARASSCSADSECRSLAVGGKACGGPTGYEAYSTQAADPAAMTALAQHEHDLALQEARESHRVSNCMMLGDPGARCEAHKCVTGGPGGVGNPRTR